MRLLLDLCLLLLSAKGLIDSLLLHWCGSLSKRLLLGLRVLVLWLLRLMLLVSLLLSASEWVTIACGAKWVAVAGATEGVLLTCGLVLVHHASRVSNDRLIHL